MAAPESTPLFPAGWSLVLDPSTRRIDGGRVIVGGAPLRLLRLTVEGAAAVDAWVDGCPVGSAGAGRRLARRLVDAGVAHPRPPANDPAAVSGRVTIVIPVRDRSAGLADTLARLGPGGPAVLVVDDGSRPAEARATAGLATRFGARVVRREVGGGPAAARNTGWREARTELVAFVDADCQPDPGWLAGLVPHFDDQAVAAAAPRIRSMAAPGTPRLLAAYEGARSPLDRGPGEAAVRPRGRVPFVPSAALVVRRRVLADLGGFDESWAVGEDVDLVWRLVAAGLTVRYVPQVGVAHPARRSWREWGRQRVGYGTSAAALHRRHGAAVAPLVVSRWSAAAWGLGLSGFPVAGLAVAGVTTALLPAKLPLDHPWREAIRLALPGHGWAGRAVADAMRRVWWPVLLVAAVGSRRARRAAVVVSLPLLVEWAMDRPPVDPFRWVAIRLADDLSYGAGVWVGCARRGTLGALVPDLSDWPGPTRQPEDSGAP
ncbi:MAG: mycofactocin biosynthesis glycosyltransferase MftF [Acidimicrobiales bacterium]